ncbi:beta-lactamase family protein [Pseudomaricurvus alkylphenolicus]|uniref:serine hydrolase domain-containing protein n=1 Tax=Pseudomaricurvus alkylphenolicus TaxID=1306991 RepID=UPI0014212A5D|nr:serine hydrolase domain-containing protein [Pseudomaricurvus alkylphenolicus]NIB42463.1 beta-lactamase family protein [Pseudomaricurvus alkylphenolicus]
MNKFPEPRNLDQQLQQSLEALLSNQDYQVFNAVIDIQVPSQRYRFSGAAGLAAERLKMHPDQPFHWASVGKTLTALIIVQADDRGLFGDKGLDTALAEIGLFGDAVLDRLHHNAGRLITMRQLLTHTAGLRDGMTDDAGSLGQDVGGLAPRSLLGAMLQGGNQALNRHWIPWDANELDVDTAGTLNYYLHGGLGEVPVAPPGARFYYSDTGYVILGLVAEHVTGQPLQRLLKQWVFEPLGLTDTYLAYREPLPDRQKLMEEAEVYAESQPLLSSGFNLSFDWGGGGIVSSAVSMNRILQAVIQGELLSPEKAQLMCQWCQPAALKQPRTGVGLGMFRTQCQQGELWGHSGAWGAKMFYHPQGDIYFSGTVNQAVGTGNWHWEFIERVRRCFGDS